AIGVRGAAAEEVDRADLVDRPRPADSLTVGVDGADAVRALVRLDLIRAVAGTAGGADGQAVAGGVELTRTGRQVQRQVRAADVGALVGRTIEAGVPEELRRAVGRTRLAVAGAALAGAARPERRAAADRARLRGLETDEAREDDGDVGGSAPELGLD